MTKTFTASLLALSIALTSVSAVPAAAKNNEDLGRFVFGAATLFILMQALEDKNNRKPKASVSVTKNHPPKLHHPKKKKQAKKNACALQSASVLQFPNSQTRRWHT